MNLPFQPAAAPVPEPAFQKRLVTMDWDGTLSLENGPNKPLYILATLALKKGHDVVVATNMKNQGLLREMMTDLHPMMMKKDMQILGMKLPEFPVYDKMFVRQDMIDLGHKKAFISFDNEPEKIKGYIDTDFIGEVDRAGKISDIVAFAAMLGVKEEFEAAMQKLNLAPGPGRAPI